MCTPASQHACWCPPLAPMSTSSHASFRWKASCQGPSHLLCKLLRKQQLFPRQKWLIHPLDVDLICMVLAAGFWSECIRMFMCVLRAGCCQPSAPLPWWSGSAWRLTAPRPSGRDWLFWLVSPSSQVGDHDQSERGDGASSAHLDFFCRTFQVWVLAPLWILSSLSTQGEWNRQRTVAKGESRAVCYCCRFRSIIMTAFMGTSVIFTCFTLSALYAKRRSYLFLGGECQRVSDWSADFSWVILSHCCLQVPWCLASLCSSSCLSLTSSSAPSWSSRYRPPYIWNACVKSNNRRDSSSCDDMCLLILIFMSFQAHLYLGFLLMCGFVLFDTQLIIEKAENGDKDYVWWVWFQN